MEEKLWERYPATKVPLPLETISEKEEEGEASGEVARRLEQWALEIPASNPPVQPPS
jgi:hypothetical protein